MTRIDTDINARARLRARLWTITRNSTLLLALVIILFPLYWMIVTSFKTQREIYREPSLWPNTFTLRNYEKLLDNDFLVAVKNSLIISCTVTATSVFVAALAAYSIVRYRYRFRGVVGRLILMAYLTPSALLFIPLSILMARLQLGDTLIGLIIAYLTFTVPLSTWLLQGYLKGIPRELEEQGLIDGHTRFGALMRIVLPLSAPGLAAVSIFVFSGAWNELLLGLVLINSESNHTTPLALNFMITSDVLPWGPLMAGSVVASVPLMILYFIAQRFIEAGLTSGAVKG